MVNTAAENNWIDYDTYQGICFDVVEIEDQYNLQFVFLRYNEEGYVDGTFMIRTTSYTDNLQETANVIQKFISLQLFEHLDYWYEGHIFDVDGDERGTVDWGEYGVDMSFMESLLIEPTAEKRVLH